MDKKFINVDELKKIQLDMLVYIADFCDRNDIKYFLAYGTLIGCVRHKGYIPWDDDIDICMPRPDYDRFLELFNKETPKYQVVSFELNKNYGLPFAKVNDTRTMMSESMYSQDVYGVYIDVFPLDGCDKEGKLIEKGMWLRQLINAKRAVLNQPGRTFKKKVILTLGKLALLFVPLSKILERIQNLCKTIPYDKAEYVAYIPCLKGDGRKVLFLKSDLQETTTGEFEGHTFSIPKNYDLYLTKIYGNYMELPPVADRVSTHVFKAWWK